MDVTSRRIATALKTAIQREERTAAAYGDQARKTKDPGAGKVLEALVKQELSHARKLKLILNHGVDSSVLGKRSRLLADSLHVLNDDIRMVEKSGDAARVLARAIKAEENSMRLYSSLEKIYRGLEVAELFGKLAQEEESHRARLEKALARL
ncbi:MAG: ferritin family protein [bacterium]